MSQDDYPLNDESFEETHLENVVEKDGYLNLHLDSGFFVSFLVSKLSGVKPKKDDAIRMYGPSPVRGLFINGKKAFYETHEEYQEKTSKERYLETGQDWLDAWDADKTVWSVEMGGLGPSYEQAIQVLAAETLRHLLLTKPDFETDEGRTSYNKGYHTWSMDDPIVKKVGPSGAMMNASRNLASNIYSQGPYKCFSNPEVKDRLIQVERVIGNFYA